MGILGSKKKTDKKDEKPKSTSKEKTVEVELLITSYQNKGKLYAKGDTFSVTKGKAEALVNVGRVKLTSKKSK